MEVIEPLEPRRLLTTALIGPLPADPSPTPNRTVTNLVIDKNPLINLPAQRLPGVTATMTRPATPVARPTPKPTAPAPTVSGASAPVAAAAESLSPESSAYTLPTGALTGKFVFTGAGHGWQWNTTLNRYATDRGDNLEIVEDFGNQDQMSLYADYLLRASATVIPTRPVGRQINEVVLDNDSAGVSFSGAWSNSSSTRYYDEDYGASADAIPYRFASTTTGAESATATYTPSIPAAGLYPVYTWVLRGTDRTSQLYRVNHSGGSVEIRVDHSKVGSGWVYLGTYHFNAGASATAGSVTISNNGAAGKVVIADTIRFGNGMGDYVWTSSGAAAVSGYPREDENSYHWLARSIGIGATPSSIIGSGNVSAPSNMAQYMFSGSFGEAVYVSFHSNAAGGRGAVGLIDSDQFTPNQDDLALFLGRQINQDMQALNGTFEFDWSTRTTHTYSGGFGEIDLGANAEMDATIIEVAFHDQSEDAALMRDPRVRDQLARSTLQGTIEYFVAHGGVASNTSLPTKPTSLRALSNSSGEVTLNWTAGPSTPVNVYGAAPTGYRIYTSTSGYGFNLAATIPTNSTSITITNLDPNVPLYIRVTATNAGGESLPSEVMTALPSGGDKQVLIVSGFDRFDRTTDFRYAYAHTGDGLVDRVWSRYNNSFDYLAIYGAAIQAAKPGTHVASTSNDFVISGAVNLSDYDAVIWVLGLESTTTRTFDATEQTKVTQFLAAGGHLFLSGAEIGWDLDQQNNGRSFFENTLKANYVADDANTYTANIAASGIFAGLGSIAFYNGGTSTGANAWSNLQSQTYNVATPDVIAPQAGAIAALTYSTGSAAIQVTGTGGSGNIVLFAFPFETMTSAPRRTEVMARILDFFNSASATPGTPDLVAATDSGSSTTDNLTNFNNASPARSLQFSVPNTIPGALVTLFANGIAIGSATATGSTTLITTTGALALADGLRSITARQTEPGHDESPNSTPLDITIDTAAPTVTFAPIASPVLTPPPTESFTFSEPVANMSIDTLSLTAYDPTTNLLAPDQFLAGSTTHFILNFLDAVAYNAGTYTLSVDPSVTDLAGNNLTGPNSITWTLSTLSAYYPATISRNPADPNALDVAGEDGNYTFSLPPLVVLQLDGPSFTLTTDLNFPLVLNSNTHLKLTTSQNLPSLAIRTTSTVDTQDNDILLTSPNPAAHNAALTQIREYLATGQLFSSTALNNPAQNTTLGYAPLADLTATPSTSLLIKYTYHGDTDLDGRVSRDDLARLDRGLAMNLSSWLAGNSNHDNIIDALDLSLAHHAFSTQTVTL